MLVFTVQHSTSSIMHAACHVDGKVHTAQTFHTTFTYLTAEWQTRGNCFSRFTVTLDILSGSDAGFISSCHKSSLFSCNLLYPQTWLQLNLIVVYSRLAGVQFALKQEFVAHWGFFLPFYAHFVCLLAGVSDCDKWRQRTLPCLSRTSFCQCSPAVAACSLLTFPLLCFISSPELVLW